MSEEKKIEVSNRCKNQAPTVCLEIGEGNNPRPPSPSPKKHKRKNKESGTKGPHSLSPSSPRGILVLTTVP